MFMMSSGGLTAADLFQGKDAILSGPAGGVVGMVETARLAGFDKVIGFDMGGTSTDVAHYDGDYERAFDTEVAGVRMRAPMMRIHTVAAGGGSILHFDARPFPRRARIRPAPIPGPPATAAAARSPSPTPIVMLGKLQPDFFPAIFGPARISRSTPQVVRDEVRRARRRDRRRTAPEEVAEGFVTIAVENMANAIKKISVQRGYDVTEYLLNCFGGAGGQHACLVADALGMEAVLIHPFSGLLSAYGIGLSGVFASRQQALLQPLAEQSLEAIDELSATPARRRLRGVRGAGHRRGRRLLAADPAHPLRRHRHDLAGEFRQRLARGRARGIRGSAQGAVRLHLRRQADDRRIGRRRGQ